ncbi:helix-turn-helix domain-containing protein [Rhodospira trueperi]|jgi:transcriptional regulator with XRE-family HTH domain|uniref:Transcriptional regulator, contains XRE-family HTH domain n=1 Tax=Rhodospira trueperi TaxID=69960 RepID=A0A1G7EDB3_9PROT|nr:helix-turn-helix domain-containing protein [Rhodospira trueperi]SDE61649.1 Transcriptional regulator, contains XRE-family HTH domain [Rhodospira trueperi]
MMASEELREGRRRRAASIDGPDPIDIHVGQRMRLRRTMLGKSQDQMARALGVSFQQVQKYERGTNRISASRLFDVSRFLNVPVSYFFEDLTKDAVAARDEEVKVHFTDDDIEMEDGADPMKRTESLELIQTYWRLPTEVVRSRVLEMLKSLVRSSPE